MTVAVCSFFHPSTGTWTHLVSDFDTRAAAVIDPVLDFDVATGRASSASAQDVLEHARGHNLRIEWILETHAHADHLTAADWLKRELGGVAKTGIGVGIVDVQKHFAKAFGLGAEFRTDGSQFDRLFADGECVALGRYDIEVIATPGHTGDGVSYRIGDAVFVGDTLFAPERGTGRCDFPGADAATQFRSIKRLYTLPDATRVFLCHDYPACRRRTAGANDHRCGEERQYPIERTHQPGRLHRVPFIARCDAGAAASTRTVAARKHPSGAV